MNNEHNTSKALAIFKPDAIRRDLQVVLLHELAGTGLDVGSITWMTLTTDEARDLYAQHANKDFFDGLVSFMTSGQSMLIEVSGVDCITRLRLFVDSIRLRYGTSVRENVIHGSDSVEAGEREVSLFFGHVKKEQEKATA